MRKVVLVGTVVLTLGLAFAQTTEPTAPTAPSNTGPVSPEAVDIALKEAGPWALDAVRWAVQQGIIIGYPDKTFRLTESMTRQEAALVLYRLVTAYNLDQFNPTEIETLRRAIDELRTQLAPLLNAPQNPTQTDNSDQIRALQQQLTAQGQQISNQGQQITTLTGRVDGNTRAIEELRTALRALEAARVQVDLGPINTNLTNLTNRIQALEAQAAQLAAQLRDLQSRQVGNPQAEAELRAQLAAVRNELAERTKDLATMRNQLAALNGRLEALEKQVDAQGKQISQINQLSSQGQQQGQQLGQVGQQLAAQGQQITAQGQKIADLTRQVSEQGQLISALRTDLTDVRNLLTETRTNLAGLDGRVKSLEDRTSALEGKVTDLEGRVAGLETRVTTSEGRINTAEGRITDLDTRVTAQAADLRDLRNTLLPERAPIYVSASVFGSNPESGPLGRVVVGHDAIFGPVGVRASLDFGFSKFNPSAAGDITFRVTQLNFDGYGLFGGGNDFSDPNNSRFFGEVGLGASFRFLFNFALFGEGRYRYYFDGAGSSTSSIVAGLQFRF